VLLDFWTYGCINCLHVIPDLEKLEKKYANQLVIIGVHSGKYENEKETDNIRRVIVRYDIAHPVYNDADFAVWHAYNVNAWPTRVLIDPAGYIVGYVPGEGNYEPIDQAINKLAAEFRARGELNEQPLRLALERASVGDLPLAFPGKVLADEKSNRLFIADSSHNRIVVTSLDGALVEAIGTGQAAAVDGPASAASFFRPQGMALDGDFLYVADTENHLIRRIDLKSHSVETIAGTGRRARGPSKTGPARDTDLNSPWDLQLAGRSLYIAMAGPHQIWKLDLDQKVVGVFAGDGREGPPRWPAYRSALCTALRNHQRWKGSLHRRQRGERHSSNRCRQRRSADPGWREPVRIWRSGWIRRRGPASASFGSSLVPQ
jgi:hypothetical protein